MPSGDFNSQGISFLLSLDNKEAMKSLGQMKYSVSDFNSQFSKTFEQQKQTISNLTSKINGLKDSLKILGNPSRSIGDQLNSTQSRGGFQSQNPPRPLSPLINSRLDHRPIPPLPSSSSASNGSEYTYRPLPLVSSPTYAATNPPIRNALQSNIPHADKGGTFSSGSAVVGERGLPETVTALKGGGFKVTPMSQSQQTVALGKIAENPTLGGNLSTSFTNLNQSVAKLSSSTEKQNRQLLESAKNTDKLSDRIKELIDKLSSSTSSKHTSGAHGGVSMSDMVAGGAGGGAFSPAVKGAAAGSAAAFKKAMHTAADQPAHPGLMGSLWNGVKAVGGGLASAGGYALGGIKDLAVGGLKYGAKNLAMRGLQYGAEGLMASPAGMGVAATGLYGAYRLAGGSPSLGMGMMGAEEIQQMTGVSPGGGMPPMPRGGGLPGSMGPGQGGVSGMPAGSGRGGASKLDAGQQNMMRGVYSAYMKTGKLSDNQARALTAEVGRENNYQEKTIFGTHQDEGKGRKTNLGFLSWQGGRKEKLEKFLTERGLMKDGHMEKGQASLDAMAQFSVGELKGPYAKSMKAFMENPNIDPEEASKMMGPGGYIGWARGQKTIGHGADKKAFDSEAHDARRRSHLASVNQMVEGANGKEISGSSPQAFIDTNKEPNSNSDLIKKATNPRGRGKRSGYTELSNTPVSGDSLAEYKGKKFDPRILDFVKKVEGDNNLRISGGHRTEKRNREVHGAKNSHHMSATGSDFVGTKAQMEAGLRQGIALGADPVGSQIHNAGSGTHLHLQWSRIKNQEKEDLQNRMEEASVRQKEVTGAASSAFLEDNKKPKSNSDFIKEAADATAASSTKNSKETDFFKEAQKTKEANSSMVPRAKAQQAAQSAVSAPEPLSIYNPIPGIDNTPSPQIPLAPSPEKQFQPPQPPTPIGQNADGSFMYPEGTSGSGSQVVPTPAAPAKTQYQPFNQNSGLGAFGNSMVKGVGSILGGVGGLVQNTIGGIGGGIQAGYASGQNPLVGAMGGLLGGTLGGLKGAATGAAGLVGGAVSGVGSILGGIAGGAGDLLNGIFNGGQKPVQPPPAAPTPIGQNADGSFMYPEGTASSGSQVDVPKSKHIFGSAIDSEGPSYITAEKPSLGFNTGDYPITMSNGATPQAQLPTDLQDSFAELDRAKAQHAEGYKKIEAEYQQNVNSVTGSQPLSMAGDVLKGFGSGVVEGVGGLVGGVAGAIGNPLALAQSTLSGAAGGLVGGAMSGRGALGGMASGALGGLVNGSMGGSVVGGLVNGAMGGPAQLLGAMAGGINPNSFKPPELEQKFDQANSIVGLAKTAGVNTAAVGDKINSVEAASKSLTSGAVRSQTADIGSVSAQESSNPDTKAMVEHLKALVTNSKENPVVQAVDKMRANLSNTLSGLREDIGGPDTRRVFHNHRASSGI